MHLTEEPFLSTKRCQPEPVRLITCLPCVATTFAAVGMAGRAYPFAPKAKANENKKIAFLFMSLKVIKFVKQRYNKISEYLSYNST